MQNKSQQEMSQGLSLQHEQGSIQNENIKKANKALKQM